MVGAQALVNFGIVDTKSDWLPSPIDRLEEVLKPVKVDLVDTRGKSRLLRTNNPVMCDLNCVRIQNKYKSRVLTPYCLGNGRQRQYGMHGTQQGISPP